MQVFDYVLLLFFSVVVQILNAKLTIIFFSPLLMPAIFRLAANNMVSQTVNAGYKLSSCSMQLHFLVYLLLPNLISFICTLPSTPDLLHKRMKPEIKIVSSMYYNYTIHNTQLHMGPDQQLQTLTYIQLGCSTMLICPHHSVPLLPSIHRI